jgi:hypothetical protein
MNEGLEKSIKAKVAEKALEHGIEESKLLAHHGARYKMMLAMQVGQPATEPKIVEAVQTGAQTP